MKRPLIIFLTIFLIALFAKAQNADTIRPPRLKLDLPLIDGPYFGDAMKAVNGGKASVGGFFKGYANPSMQQSLAVTTDFYSAAHFGINSLLSANPSLKRWKWLGVMALDFLSLPAPGGDGWLHEEYHRAVMTGHHTNSFNDMNTFPMGKTLVSVNHVKDADLIRFKKENAPDFIRMPVAGIEGEYMLIDKLQQNNFFYKQKLPHEFLYAISTLNSIMYVNSCWKPEENDVETDKANQSELLVKSRDFTGMDFTGWAYDIFRPDEPYENRGVHPNGNGINRYRKTTDLLPNELEYLKKQGRLQYLNLMSPMMLGFRSISIKDMEMNFSVRHLLTSFGSDIALNVFMQKGKHNLLFTYHNYQNYKHYFPGLEARLIDYPLMVASVPVKVTQGLLVGSQPSRQNFMTSKPGFLLAATTRADLEINHTFLPYLEVEAKTKGWVAGNPYTNSNVAFRLGVSARFY